TLPHSCPTRRSSDLWTVYAFGIIMGLLWLSTVPLTNGIVANMFGVKYLTMLSGIVFFTHQVGSFFGGWLGGLNHDLSGNYNAVRSEEHTSELQSREN